MKKNIIFLLLTSILFACNQPDKKTDEEQIAIKKRQNDSLMIIYDSLMQVKIEVPPLIDSTFFSVTVLEEFNRLARETGGELKVLSNSKFVAKTITEIITNNSSDNTDLMIIIDKTGSMTDDLDNIKKGLDQILNSIKEFKNIRLSIGTYGDKNVDGKLWYNFKNFENNFQETSNFINSIKTTGGGDFPESVYDGIYQAFEEGFWHSESKRIVILLGDAPSLDSTLTDHTIEDIIRIAKKDKINMNFYPIVLSPYAGTDGLVSEDRMEKKLLIKNIYPNPTYGPVSLDLTSGSDLTIEIINQKGSVVKSINTSSSFERLDLSDLIDGIYIIRAYDKLKNFDNKKVILNK